MEKKFFYLSLGQVNEIVPTLWKVSSKYFKTCYNWLINLQLSKITDLFHSSLKEELFRKRFV